MRFIKRTVSIFMQDVVDKSADDLCDDAEEFGPIGIGVLEIE